MTYYMKTNIHASYVVLYGLRTSGKLNLWTMIDDNIEVAENHHEFQIISIFLP